MTTVKIIQGHVLAALKTLPDESVHVCCSSPPYWGLRSYGTDPQIWGGSPGCQHVWGAEQPKPGSEYREGLSTSIFQGREDKGAIREAFAKPRRSRHVADVKNPDSKQATSAGTMYEATGGQFCQRCGALKCELGSEPSIDWYIRNLVEVFREVRRVMRDDAVCWLNIGDTMATGGNGLKPGDLCMIPHRLAMGLQADGWYVRMDAIWAKDAPMPESVNGWRWEQHRVKVAKQKRDSTTKIGGSNARECRPSFPCANNGIKHETAKWIDCPGCPKCLPHGDLVLRRGSWRPTKAHEYIFQLTKSERYYGDAVAVREPAVSTEEGFRNPRSVFRFPPEPSGREHYAAYPSTLPEMAIKSSSSAQGVCSVCGAPQVRIVKKESVHRNELLPSDPAYRPNRYTDTKYARELRDTCESGMYSTTKTLGWCPSCSCVCCDDRDLGGTGCTNSYPETVPAVVLDPFSGSGTTGVVAAKLGRNYIGIELNPTYVKMSVKRIRAECGLLAEIEVEEA